MKLTTHLELPALDLRRRYFERRKHGIVVIGTWYRHEDDGHQEPCLALLHGGRPIKRDETVPVIIPLSSAWKWAMHKDVGNPEHCGAMARQWLRDNLLPGSHRHTGGSHILDAINDNLPDLIAMPPAPMGEIQSIGTIIITDSQTGVTTEREMLQDV